MIIYLEEFFFLGLTAAFCRRALTLRSYFSRNLRRVNHFVWDERHRRTYMRVRPTDAGCSFCVIAARRIFIALREVIRMENKKIFIMLYLRQSTKCDTVRLIWSKSATLTLILLGKKWPPSKINLARTQQNNDHLLGRQLINNAFVSALYYLWQKTLNSISVFFLACIWGREPQNGFSILIKKKNI